MERKSLEARRPVRRLALQSRQEEMEPGQGTIDGHRVGRKARPAQVVTEGKGRSVPTAVLVVKAGNADELSEGRGKVRQTSGITGRILKGSMRLGDRNRLHTPAPSG